MKRNLRSAAGYMAIAFILGQTFTILRGQQRLPNQIDPRIEGLTGSAVEDSMPVNGITLRFKPTDKQQAELEKLLEGLPLRIGIHPHAAFFLYHFPF